MQLDFLCKASSETKPSTRHLALNNQFVVDGKQTGDAPRSHIRKVFVSLAIHNALERRSSIISEDSF